MCDGGLLDVAFAGARNALMKRIQSLIRLVSAAAIVAGGVACMSDPPPESPQKAAQTETKKTPDGFADLTNEDCRAWADRFETRVNEATHRRIAECAKQTGKSTPEDTADEKQIAKETERLHELILDQCGQQVGAAYPRADAECYMGAKKLEEWPGCHFKSAFFADYGSVAKNHAKMFDERCRRIASGNVDPKG